MKTKKIVALLMAAVMLFTFAACGGTGGKLTATLNEIYEDGGLKSYYVENPDFFMKAAQNDLLMSEADAQDFLNNSDKWVIYALNVEIKNQTEEAYTFVGFEAENAQSDGFYFSNCPVNAELSLPSSEETEIYPATVVVNSEKIDAVKLHTLVSALEIKVLCYPTPADDNEEVPESKYEKLKVENNIEAPQADGNEKDEKEELYAKRSTIEDGSSFLDIYRGNQVAFVNQAEQYGMDSETAAKALAKDGGWKCYILYIALESKADEDITVYTVDYAESGKNGVWVNKVSQYGEFSLAPDGKDELPVEILVDTAALGGKTIEQVVSQMNIQLIYAKGALTDAQGNESVNLRKTVDVK